MDRWAVAVVVHHPRAAEHAGERLPLPGRGVQAIAVPDQHSTKTYRRPMTTGDDYRRGRHVLSAFQVHLAFVAIYRRCVLTGEHIPYVAEVPQRQNPGHDSPPGTLVAPGGP